MALKVAVTARVLNTNQSAFSVTAGAVTPVPVSDTLCGEPAPSATVTLATLEPVETGVNVTDTVQLAPAPRVEPQVVVNA